MNQTKKRLSIINLAISITDIETIQLQILKLRILHSDEKIQEIISTLQEENYAQAQAQIKTYIETPNHEILQRSFQHEKERQEAKDRAIIEEFDLFTVETPAPVNENTVLELDDMMQMDKESKVSPTKIHETVDFDMLLNVKTNEVMPDNIDIDINDPLKNDFWNTLENDITEENPIEKDTFFDNHETTVTEIKIDDFPELSKEEIKKENEPKVFNEEELLHDILEKVTHQVNTVDEVQNNTPAEDDEAKEVLTVSQVEEIYEKAQEKNEERSEENHGDEEEVVPTIQNYKAISYIEQKLNNMQVQYPTIEANPKESFDSVNQWLAQIAQEGYTEEDVESVIKKVMHLQEENPEEAATLLLLCAATESKYAQFQLARALFKGDLLQQNIEEAFTLINRLAVNDDYPEAICDLAQFYEYGINTPKDKKKAEVLYEEAVDLGIQRAIPHYERLRKENKGFLSFLTK